ncbi:MAG: four helix bundle protein [Sideroxydans sp. RIFOXYB12_FULL_59_6]|nr:MAG: four helix bundle protein [Sideroxydans sp. RIFOXYB12_FULL_59_6]
MKRGHRNLKAWQQAMELVTAVYAATSSFPSNEKFGLTSQLQRAAVSVPANIAEGFARNGTKELLQFLSISAGSLSELDTLIELAARLGYMENAEELNGKVDEVSGLLMGLAASIKRRAAT